ncbi:phosphoglucomutase/phosphomannomutase, C-terminal domain protein, partial [Escherichia coli 3.4870]
MKPNA